jgi:hypothetical protein
MTQPNPPATANIDTLYQDIRQLIEAAKTHVATQVNQALVLTYWQIGKTIKTELLQDARSEYGLATLKQLAQQLQQEYGAGFSYSSLTRMIKFYSYLPDQLNCCDTVATIELVTLCRTHQNRRRTQARVLHPNVQ